MYANPNAALLSQYKNDSIMTAGPIELIVMLYDGVIKNLKLVDIFMEDKAYEKVNVHLQKAQNIILELIRILDLKYDIAEELMRLYDYMLHELVMINIKKDSSKIPELIEIISNLKEAWQTVQNKNMHMYTTGEE
ncbi:flagellar export chaperone FliS [Christensenellaceae bacterium OttesenSCG-928-M15]|nr:flagellar export chaperone FliS [Christensenellaceae bacterium OttesenSCG-928-M15]